MTHRALVPALLAALLPFAALAEEPHDVLANAEPAHAGEHHFELAVDFGEEYAHGFSPTAGLFFAYEFLPHNRVSASGALVFGGEHGVKGGDLALGYYHTWDVAGFEPELGIELGAMQEHSIHPFARFAAGLFHGLGGNLFAGVVTDAAVLPDATVIGRALVEIGVRL